MKKSLFWFILVFTLSTSSFLLSSVSTSSKIQTYVFHNQMSSADVDQLVNEMDKNRIEFTIHTIEFNSNGKLSGIHATVKRGSNWVRFCTDCVGKIVITKSFMKLNVHMDGNVSE